MNLTHITKTDLIKGFLQLGLKAGSCVEVHSSLSSFGYVEGGAESVIAALISVVGEEGSIIMSGYPVSREIPLTEEDRDRGIEWKVRILDPDSDERSGMGVIVDTFKKREDVVCGATGPIVCAWGKDKELLQEGYEELIEKDGYVLLLGVEVHRVSSMHLADKIPLPKEFEEYTDEISTDILKNYPSDQWSIGLRSKKPHDDVWQKVFDRADQEGLIQHRQIGQAICYLFKARDLVEMLSDWRRDDPYGLFGVNQS